MTSIRPHTKHAMTKRESKFGLLFRHWVMSNRINLISCTFELKQTITDSIPFSCVEQAQLDHGMAVKWGKKGALIRVEAGTVGAPDYVYFYNAPAYVVIRYPDFFAIIDIESFIVEKERSKRKSLTADRARDIAYDVVELKG